EILDRTAQLYRENFLLLAGIAAPYAGVLLVLSLSQIGIQELLRTNHMADKIVWVTLGVGLLMFPIIVIAGGIAVAANNRAVSWVNLGQPASIRSAYRNILPRLGRYLWLMLLTTMIVWLPCLVIYGSYAAFLLTYGQSRGLFVQKGARDPETLMV